MIQNRERLLGFDARLDVQDYPSSFWDQERREVFLLRPEIDFPFSVDGRVWPSVFRYFRLEGPQEDLGYFQVEAGPHCGGHELWVDLTKMEARLREAGEARRSARLGICLFAPSSLTADQYGSNILNEKPRPSELPRGSALLGYDVAGAGQTSALSGCEYSAEELRALRPQWRQRINDHGLLKTVDDAAELKEISAKRVPEHAPFHVYALYRLP